jgi:hypothetical protein
MVPRLRLKFSQLIQDLSETGIWEFSENRGELMWDRWPIQNPGKLLRNFRLIALNFWVSFDQIISYRHALGKMTQLSKRKFRSNFPRFWIYRCVTPCRNWTEYDQKTAPSNATTYTHKSRLLRIDAMRPQIHSKTTGRPDSHLVGFTWHLASLGASHHSKRSFCSGWDHAQERCGNSIFSNEIRLLPCFTIWMSSVNLLSYSGSRKQM